MANATATQVQELYIGYLGRPAEQAGLSYWTGQDVENLKASLAAQPEYQENYPSADRAAIVRQVYTNLFDRAPTTDEVNYWAYSSQTPTNDLISAFLAGASTNDAATVAAKAATAQSITSLYGASGTSAQVNSTFDSITANAAAEQNLSGGTLAAAYTKVTPAAITAAQSSTAGGVTTYSFFSNNAQTVALADAAASVAFVQSAGATNTSASLADVTVSGNAEATGTAINGKTLAAAASATTIDSTISTLHVNVAATATANTETLTLSNFDKLAVVDGAASTAGLVLDLTTTGNVSQSAFLSTVNTGSGADQITVSTIAAAELTGVTSLDNAKVGAITVNSGDGADAITAYVQQANVTVNAGAGNDNVVLNFTAGVAQDNASTTTLGHGATVTLGAGQDILRIDTTGNLVNFDNSSDAKAISSLASNLVKVTDFNAVEDTLVFGAAGTTFTAANVTTVADTALTNATTLTAALNTVASAIGTASAKAAVFHFDGNTYVFNDAGTAGVDVGDSLVQLAGVQTLADVAAHVNA